MIVDELIAILGFDLRGEGDLRRFNDGIRSAENQANHFVSSLSKIGAAVAGIWAGLEVGARGRQFISDITNAGRQAENFKTQLTTAFSGDEALAANALDWIEKFAAISPEGVNEITAAFIKLKAYGLDPTTGVLKSVGDAAAGMGKSTDQGVEAIADAVTGEFERLKEFAGIKAKQTGEAVTFAWNQSGKEQSLTVKKNSQEIQKALTGIMDGRFSGAMERQSRTFDGILAKVQDRWQRFLRAISDAGYYDRLKERFSGFADFFEALDENGTLPRLANGIGRLLTRGVDTSSHLVTQAYRIAAGFYNAADAIVTLAARINGLPKAFAAAGLGVGLLATSAVGRNAMLALARRVPMIAALLVMDDIMSGLAGDKSMTGSMEGGQQALDRIRSTFQEIRAAADELAGTLNGIFGIQRLTGEGDFSALIRVAKDLGQSGIVRIINNVADGYQMIASILKGISDLIKDPDQAMQRFGDALIAQVDRIVAALDEKLGGALTKFGLIGDVKVQDGPAPTLAIGGGAPSSPMPKAKFEPDASLVRDGMVNAEGLGAQFGVDPAKLASGAEYVMKAVLNLTDFTSAYGSAKQMLTDMGQTTEAKLDLNLSAFTAKIAQAKAELSSLKAMAGQPVVGGMAPARIATGAAQP